MTQNIEERAKINTFRSVSAMIAIGIINIITLPLISKLGGSDKRGYLLVAVLYGAIFAACHIFCFAKTKKAVTIPEKKKIPIKLQIQTVLQNKPYLLALLGQFLFGVTLYGRNADALYYFKYVEGTESLFTTYSMDYSVNYWCRTISYYFQMVWKQRQISFYIGAWNRCMYAVAVSVQSCRDTCSVLYLFWSDTVFLCRF